MTGFLLATWLTFSATDAVTTMLAIHAGAYEWNPILRHPVALVTAKATAGVTAIWWTRRTRQAHPRLVRLVAFGATVAYAGLTVHNWQVYQEQQRRR